MKKSFISLVVLLTALFVFASASFSQGKAKTGPDSSTIRDSDLEKDSLHNLEVARHYFKLKKAYLAALKRCEEIDAGNPNFARIDEVLYIAGESSLRLAENGGKQKNKNEIPSDIQAKEKVTPEAVLLNLLFEILIGRGDHSNIDGHRPPASNQPVGSLK